MAITRAFLISQAAGNYILTNNTTTISGTTLSDVHTFSATGYRSAKYLITLTNGTDYHTVELVLQHDGSTVDFVEYGSVYNTQQLAVYSADIDSGNVRLRATPVNSGTNVFRFNVELTSS